MLILVPECIVTDRKRLGRKPRQPYSLKRTEPQKLIKPSSNSSLDQGHSTDGGDFRGSAIQWKPSPELRLHSVDLGKAISHENLASMQQLEHFWINPDPPPTPPAVSPRVQVASSYSNKYTEFAATTPAPPAVSPRVQVASSYPNKYTEFAATAPAPPAVSPRVQVASSYSNKYTGFAATTPAPPAVSPRVQVASSYPNKYTEFAATVRLQVASSYSNKYTEIAATTLTPPAVLPTIPVHYQEYSRKIEVIAQNLQSSEYPPTDVYDYTSWFQTPNVVQPEPVLQDYHHDLHFQAHWSRYH
ncbi:hypothetical protein GG344DRAFT_79447 [Lentinula edodes]|nr:hypothetical protein GG344DRAFT_79447 [Lentinula edodes]